MRLDTISAEAYIDNFSMITIVVDKPFSIIPSLVLIDRKGAKQPLTIDIQEDYHEKYIYKCKTPQPLDLYTEYWVACEEIRIPLKVGSVVRTERFDTLFYDDGVLGAIYSPDSTTFKVWSPVANEIRLKYKTAELNSFSECKMIRSEKGVWHLTLEGNHHLTEYTYLAKVNHEWVETTDPYTRSVTINGERSVVINLSETDPEGWNRSEKRINLRAKTDSILYEVHIRDFTVHADSGVKNKGKYLGLTEKSTKTSNGYPTGLDYLKGLGVTHVQLMPVADFGSVDETKSDKEYNWGYDPVHFFAPEGSYSTDPYDPVSRVKELKVLIQTLQTNGLSVILDVVFNHVYIREDSAFEKLVPGYYFRYDDGGNPVNGTGVGNDTASERKMVRKFIIDALTYWLNEYKVDGFRFDLMGIHDIETMNIASKKLKSLNPGVFLLGEGWDLNTYLEPERKASLSSAKRMPDYSFFNDAFRDHVKGSIFPEGASGFINGNQDDRVKNQMIHVIRGYAGNQNLFLAPEQSINYTECHDNHTLFDLLAIRHPHENETTRRRRQQLALAFTLFARGVPFIHAGQEFFRTKHGAENSYNLPDRINAIDWNSCETNDHSVVYFRDLIKIKKEQPIFRDGSAELQEKNVPRGALGFELQRVFTDKEGGALYWKKVLLFFNQTLKPIGVPLEHQEWNIAVEDQRCGKKATSSDCYLIPPLSFSLLYKE